MKCNHVATALTLLAAMSLLTLPSCTNKKEKPEATKTAENGPTAIVSETIQRNATITALDLDRHLVTVKNAEGETRTYAVDPGIDLSAVHVGDDVITQYSAGLAIVVDSNRAP